MDPKVLAGLIKRIYPGFTMETFENRLRLQKIIYLMRRFHLDLGYSFNLYLRGPYCPDLTRDAFQITNWKTAQPVKFDDAESEQHFISFISFIAPRKEDNDWLEIASTLAYIKDLYPSYNEKKLTEACKEVKPHLSEHQIREVLEVIA